MYRKLTAFFLVPFLMFYVIYIPYAVKKYIKYGNVEFQNPLELILGGIAGLLMIMPFSFLIIGGYILGFFVFVKIEEKLQIQRFHHFMFLGVFIGAAGYIPFLILPDSLGNWPWSIFYCALYSSFYWCFRYAKFSKWKRS